MSDVDIVVLSLHQHLPWLPRTKIYVTENGLPGRPNMSALSHLSERYVEQLDTFLSIAKTIRTSCSMY
jgi:hypothetical protein